MLYRHETKSGRRQILAGKSFERGTDIPDEVLATIPPNRIASMKRVGLLLEAVVEVTDEAEVEAMIAEGAPVEGICPQCGEGPFNRLARHISAKHESIEELESVNGSA